MLSFLGWVFNVCSRACLCCHTDELLVPATTAKIALCFALAVQSVKCINVAYRLRRIIYTVAGWMVGLLSFDVKSKH